MGTVYIAEAFDEGVVVVLVLCNRCVLIEELFILCIIKSFVPLNADLILLNFR